MHGYIIANDVSSVSLISQAQPKQFHTWRQQRQQQWPVQHTKMASTAGTGAVVKAAAAGPSAIACQRDVTPAEGVGASGPGSSRQNK